MNKKIINIPKILFTLEVEEHMNEFIESRGGRVSMRELKARLTAFEDELCSKHPTWVDEILIAVDRFCKTRKI